LTHVRTVGDIAAEIHRLTSNTDRPV
jgi:hypothetical protein